MAKCTCFTVQCADEQHRICLSSGSVLLRFLAVPPPSVSASSLFLIPSPGSAVAPAHGFVKDVIQKPLHSFSFDHRHVSLCPYEFLKSKFR